MSPILSDINESFWFPSQSSTVAADSDYLYFGILWVCVFFFVLVVGLMAFFVVKYRRKPGVEPESSPSHNMVIESIWSILPMFIVAVMFYEGFAGFVDLATPPEDSYQIDVTAKKWSWMFVYPGNYGDNTLHVPPNENITLSLESDDVLHALYIPAFRVKRDVIPGQQTKLWFNAEPGTYDLFCAEYCGDKHSAMLSKVTVHESREEYEAWLAKASDLFGQGDPLHVIGQKLFDKNGCIQCHAKESGGPKAIGPPLYELNAMFGQERELIEGQKVLVDENYIRESLTDPNAKIVKDFTPKMPSFADRFRKREEIRAITEYIKSLDPSYVKDETPITSPKDVLGESAEGESDN